MKKIVFKRSINKSRIKIIRYKMFKVIFDSNTVMNSKWFVLGISDVKNYGTRTLTFLLKICTELGPKTRAIDYWVSYVKRRLYNLKFSLNFSTFKQGIKFKNTITCRF